MAAIVTKTIKPARFESDAFARAIAAEARRLARDIQQDFEATTRTWDHKPEFETLISLEPSPVEILVGTDDEIYGYVSEGTRPHVIRPKRAKVLAFPSAYTAKTEPGVIGSRSGGPSGDIVFRPEVRHPGGEARKFDEVIQKKWERPARRRLERAMVEGAKNSGHAI